MPITKYAKANPISNHPKEDTITEVPEGDLKENHIAVDPKKDSIAEDLQQL